jgi:hypothetical protein
MKTLFVLSPVVYWVEVKDTRFFGIFAWRQTYVSDLFKHHHHVVPFKETGEEQTIITKSMACRLAQ